MNMQQFILRRLLLMIPLLIGITLIAFIISHSVPGDPIAAHLSQKSMENPEIVADLSQAVGAGQTALGAVLDLSEEPCQRRHGDFDQDSSPCAR